MVKLKEITKENYEECLSLSVANSQKILSHQILIGEINGSEVGMRLVIRDMDH